MLGHKPDHLGHLDLLAQAGNEGLGLGIGLGSEPDLHFGLLSEVGAVGQTIHAWMDDPSMVSSSFGILTSESQNTHTEWFLASGLGKEDTHSKNEKELHIKSRY